MTPTPPIDVPPHPDATGDGLEIDLLDPVAQVGPGDSALAGVLGSVGVAAVAVSTVGIGLLHVLPPTRALDPLSRTISEYALLPTGWIFDASVVILAIGSAAVLAGLIIREMTSWRSWGAVMTAVWCTGLVGLVVFPKQGFGPDTTLAGRVHWSWTLIAFFSLPIGAGLLCRRGRVGVGSSRWPRWAIRLSRVAGGWFGVLTLQTVLTAATKIPAWRLVGFVERALSATEMATVVVLALWLRSGRGDRVAVASPEKLQHRRTRPDIAPDR